MPVQTLKPGRCQAICSSTSTFAMILPCTTHPTAYKMLKSCIGMNPLLFSPARIIVLEVDPMPSSATWASGEVSERSRFDRIDLDDLYRSVICNFGKAMLWCNLQFFLLTDRDLFHWFVVLFYTGLLNCYECRHMQRIERGQGRI